MYYQGRIEHTFSKVLKEVFIHVFEENVTTELQPSSSLSHFSESIYKQMDTQTCSKQKELLDTSIFPSLSTPKH